jgi:hypothetical protein
MVRRLTLHHTNAVQVILVQSRFPGLKLLPAIDTSLHPEINKDEPPQRKIRLLEEIGHSTLENKDSVVIFLEATTISRSHVEQQTRLNQMLLKATTNASEWNTTRQTRWLLTLFNSEQGNRTSQSIFHLRCPSCSLQSEKRNLAALFIMLS